MNRRQPRKRRETRLELGKLQLPEPVSSFSRLVSVGPIFGFPVLETRLHPRRMSRKEAPPKTEVSRKERKETQRGRAGSTGTRGHEGILTALLRGLALWGLCARCGHSTSECSLSDPMALDRRRNRAGNRPPPLGSVRSSCPRCASWLNYREDEDHQAGGRALGKARRKTLAPVWAVSPSSFSSLASVEPPSVFGFIE